jgi:hypothetical protein
VKLAEFAGGDGILFGDTKNLFTDGSGKWDCCVIEKLDLEMWRRT